MRPSLTHIQSIWLTTLPALFFLAHGIGTTILKIFEASTSWYFFILFLIFTSILYISIKSLILLSNQRIRDIVLIIVISFLAALTIQYLYGVSVGTDGAYYFSFPIHTFHTDAPLSFREDPFVSFGEQPLAIYWVPSTSEYLFVALGVLFGIDISEINRISIFFSHFLLFIALMAVICRFAGLWMGLLVLAVCLAIMLGLNQSVNSITGTSIFRAHDNKSLIFGFFYWACVNLILPWNPHESDRNHIAAAAAIIAASAFFISGNFPLLAILVLFLALAAMTCPFRGHSLLAAGTFIGVMTLFIIGYKYFEETDIFEVASMELGPLSPRSFEQQIRIYGHENILWAVAFAASIAVIIINRPLSLFLGAFTLLSIFAHTETFYNLVSDIRPERALIIWRVGLLFNPYVAILVGLAALAGSVEDRRRRTLVGVAIGVAAIGVAIVRPPPVEGLRDGEFPPILAMISDHCETRDALFVADRVLATYGSGIAPGLRILVGKEYFMNWQIANLPEGSEDHRLATQARDASNFLSGRIDDPSGLFSTIRDLSPDILLVDENRVQALEYDEVVDHGYELHQERSYAIFAKPGLCAFPDV